MRQHRTLVLSICLLASMPVMAADIAGGQSPAQDGVHYINAGESTLNAGPHRSGRAGISLGAYANAARVDVASLVPYATTVVRGATTVRTLGPDAGLPFPAAGVGHFSFVQVGNADVWFGEWSSSGAQAGFNHRQVFFVGDRAGTSLPAGVVTYTLAGINRFDGSGVLEGALRANFDTGTVTAGLVGTVYRLAASATLDRTTGAFSGSAVANGSIIGTSSGQFFGAGASAVTGIATFAGNSQFDTSFGGQRN